MQAFDLYQLYRTELRDRPCPGFTVEAFPDLTRSTAENAVEEGSIVFANLDPAIAGARIDEQIQHFARLGQAFEWKIHDFDTPASLKELLEARGFAGGEPEAFLALPLNDESAHIPFPPEVRIERARDEAGLRDIIAVEEATRQERFPTHFARYAREICATPDLTSFYCAYVADQPVAAGRISLPAGLSFASLWGGCVVPAMRGRGLYSALLAHRLAEAKARGYRFVTVDAEPMSRPILLRKGFQHVCWTDAMRLRRPAETG